MSAKNNLSAKAVDFEAKAREQMRRHIEMIAATAEASLDTKLKIAESLQFQRGYN